VVNLDAGAELKLAVPVEGELVAIVGENRKLLVFPLEQVAEMARGRGVRLQRYKDGGVSDAKTFAGEAGLTWRDSSERTWTVPTDELREWMGNRADAGRLPPKGFPKTNRFAPR
jgi:topoisomerase-4 subunit A